MNLYSNPHNHDKHDTYSVSFSRSLTVLGEQLEANFEEGGIQLIPLSSNPTVESIKNYFNTTNPIFACDFYIKDVESGVRVIGGYEIDGIVNIDHHSNTSDFFTNISSGNLAIEYVLEHGAVSPEALVAINHTDCDSIISSLILRGYMEPHPALAQAVIAADHTGELNPIADLLQALDKKRDIKFSVTNLVKLLKGEPLDPEAWELLSERLKSRDRTQQESELFIRDGLVAYRVLDSRIEGEFLNGFIPEAAVIFYFYQKKDSHNLQWVAKGRLGRQAPDGCSLFDLNLAEFDPSFGGRWNAGGNDRGGVGKSPEEYIDYLTSTVNSPNSKFRRK